MLHAIQIKKGVCLISAPIAWRFTKTYMLLTFILPNKARQNHTLRAALLSRPKGISRKKSKALFQFRPRCSTFLRSDTDFINFTWYGIRLLKEISLKTLYYYGIDSNWWSALQRSHAYVSRYPFLPKYPVLNTSQSKVKQQIYLKIMSEALRLFLGHVFLKARDTALITWVAKRAEEVEETFLTLTLAWVHWRKPENARTAPSIRDDIFSEIIEIEVTVINFSKQFWLIRHSARCWTFFLTFLLLTAREGAGHTDRS